MERDRDAEDVVRARANGLDEVATRGDVPDFRGARRHVLVELLRFVAAIRDDGVAVPANGPLDAARALAAVGLEDEARVAAALRASLLSEAAHGEAFEEAFPTFWHRLRTGIDRIATADARPSPTGANGDDDGSEAGRDAERAEEAELSTDADPPELGGDDEGNPTVRMPTERSHASGRRATTSDDSDARRYSATGGSELVDAERPSLSSGALSAVDRFVDALATLPGRRRRRSDAGSAVDARGALRASLQTGGAPIDLPRTEPTPTELRCRLLVDVSGSVLDTVDRSALLALAERFVRSALDARVFLFDTDLVEATEPFARADGDPAAALRAAEVRWGGGTRIGDAFVTLRRRDPYAVDRRTVVVVVSDGLDVGDDDLLVDGITWLAERASAVVWLNPLAVSPAFEPTSRGMSTVVPYVDALFGFAEPADLAAAARRLERRGLDGPVGSGADVRSVRRPADGGVPE